MTRMRSWQATCACPYRNLVRLLVLALLLPVTPAEARELLFDGDFESGTLAGWNPSGTGSAIVTRYGSCFSDRDTRSLSIRGRYAGLLRSSADTGQASASLTSKPFVAGRGILFQGLSERRDSAIDAPPRALLITLLGDDDSTLGQFELSTAVADLAHGCPSQPSDYSFSQHYLGTQPWQGRKVRLRFSQHPETARHGGFTLIDQVENILPSSAPADSVPEADAGLAFDVSSGFPYLQAFWPGGSPPATDELQYSWLINGESRERPYFNPCIDDLGPGHYSAKLYIRKRGELLASDTLEFSLPAPDQLPAPVMASPKASPACNQVRPDETSPGAEAGEP